MWTLGLLNPVKGAYIMSGGGYRCLPGTRVNLLEKISKFLRYIDTLPLSERLAYINSMPKLFWLYGGAGSGKSAVANTVTFDIEEAEDFDLTCFFCKRDDPDSSDPKRLFPTLADSIAKTYASYRSVLADRLSGNDAGFLGWDITMQYDMLLGSLLSDMAEPARRHVVIIDALDECGRPEDQKKLADYILSLANVAPWISVIVTSRPEPVICDVFSSPDGNCEVANINDEPDTDADLRRFISVKLEHFDMETQFTAAQIDVLVKLSAGRFILCSMLLRSFGESWNRPEDFIEFFSGVILPDPSNDPLLYLHRLYDQVLASAEEKGLSDAKLLQAMLGIIAVSAENQLLSADALSCFLMHDERYQRSDIQFVQKAIGALRAVLYVDSGKRGAIRVCHPSFLDYIRARFGVDSRPTVEELHQLMFRGCFAIMNEQLKFNVCGLEDASVLNNDVSDLEARISASISEVLQYSSLFGFRHLFASALPPNNEGVRSTVSAFLKKKSLYWLEVMSLLKAVHQAAAISYECSRFFLVSYIDLYSIFANDKNSESVGHIVSCI